MERLALLTDLAIRLGVETVIISGDLSTTSFKKEFEMAAGRDNFHHSKRTSPEEVTEQTPPQSIHPEGRRWNETVQKQAKDKGRKLDEKMNREMGKPKNLPPKGK